MNLGMHQKEKRIEHVEIETENTFQSVREEARKEVESSKLDKLRPKGEKRNQPRRWYKSREDGKIEYYKK